MGQILETIMLVCFGFSWPLNVIKAYKTRQLKEQAFRSSFLS